VPHNTAREKKSLHRSIVCALADGARCHSHYQPCANSWSHYPTSKRSPVARARKSVGKEEKMANYLVVLLLVALREYLSNQPHVGQIGAVRVHLPHLPHLHHHAFICSALGYLAHLVIVGSLYTLYTQERVFQHLQPMVSLE
jgi:hypothetical protein